MSKNKRPTIQWSDQQRREMAELERWIDGPSELQPMIDEIVADFASTKTDLVYWLKWETLVDEFENMTLAMHCHRATTGRFVNVMEKIFFMRKAGEDYINPQCAVWQYITHGTYSWHTAQQVDNFKQKIKHFEEAKRGLWRQEAETELQDVFDSVRKPAEIQ